MLYATGKVKVGDEACFPIDLREGKVYRHRFQAIAFKSDGTVIIRRLADGFTRSASERLFDQYRTEPDYRRSELHPHLEAARSMRDKPRYNWRGECACCQPHPEGARYYVTARRDDGHYAALLGPFDDHAVCLTKVRVAINLAWKLDPKAPWYSYGTAIVRDGYATPGILNSHLEAKESTACAQQLSLI